MDYKTAQTIHSHTDQIAELKKTVDNLVNRISDIELLVMKLTEGQHNAKRQRNNKPSRQ